jgi:hypothetical protein
VHFSQNLMSNITVNITTGEDYFIYTISAYVNRIKFGILLTLQFLSIPCFLYIFYQFGRQRQLRQSHHHHVILLLLIISFLFVAIELPFTEAYMYTSYVYPSSNAFCSFWNWFHYSLNIINLFLMSFASIERNWLIFHPWLVRTTRGKILFHYCPLVFCILYPSIFYIGAIFIHQCESYYDYTQLLCTWPCYFYDLNWANFDLFFNNYTPLLSIPVFCSVIYLRVLLQKRSIKQQVFKWRRDRKMILQLWAISSLYLGMWMPLQLTELINLHWNPTFLLQAQIDYIYLFPYLIHLIYPFIVLFTYPKEMLKFKKNRVGPQSIHPT